MLRKINLELNSNRGGSVFTDVRRILNRVLSIAEVYEFFKKPVSARRYNEIDSVAKFLCDFDYFKRLRTDHNFLAVKECTTYMLYEYSPPGRVSSR